MALSKAQVDCLGAVLGGCGFSTELEKRICEHLVHSRFYSWIPHIGRERTTLQPLNLQGCVERFREDRVSHVIHAGAVHLSVLRAFFGDEALGEGNPFDNPLNYFLSYAERLDRAGIHRMSVRDLFDEYRVLPGTMGKVQPSAAITGQLARLRQEAQALCAAEIFVRVAQAVVFDVGGHEPRHVVETTSGTDLLLGSLEPRPEGAVRVLVKILPEAMPARINDPTIGSTTVHQAKKAGVNVIAIEAEDGIIIDREETIAAADKAGIALVGI